MVLVQVFQITSVMYPVVGRGIEEKFNKPWAVTNGFSMNPELVNQTDLLHEQYPNGMKTEQGQPGPENKGAGCISGPGLA